MRSAPPVPEGAIAAPSCPDGMRLVAVHKGQKYYLPKDHVDRAVELAAQTAMPVIRPVDRVWDDETETRVKAAYVSRVEALIESADAKTLPAVTDALKYLDATKNVQTIGGLPAGVQINVSMTDVFGEAVRATSPYRAAHNHFTDKQKAREAGQKSQHLRRAKEKLAEAKIVEETPTGDREAGDGTT